MSHTDNRFSAVDLCHIAVFAALFAILAQVSIPMPGGVPMTLQTLAVPLAGLVLGRKKGAMSALIYLLLGAVGLPVFAGMKGGVGVLFGMTGGFLFSFPLMAWMAGLATDRKPRNPLLWFWLVAGTVVNYAVGTVWFMLISGSALIGALTACVIPFIPTTVLKILLAGLLGPLLKGALCHAGLLVRVDKKGESC